MHIQIDHKPAFALANIALEPGEQFITENGAMVAMSPTLSVETTSRATGGKGGLLKGLKRMISGESFFNNVFTASAGPGLLSIAPSLIGDITRHDLQGETLIVQGSSWLGHAPGVELDTQFGGLKALFSGEGVFFLKLSGHGPALFNSFGAIHQMDLNGSFLVDTGHVVAFDEGIDYKIRKVGGWFATLFSSEGLVMEFQGQGRLWIQSRNPDEFGGLVGRLLPPRKQ